MTGDELAVRDLLVASTNRHKVREIGQVLAPLGVHVVGLSDVDAPGEEPVEDGATFEANARIKAVAYARATGRHALADDSGLEVDALDGAPGVRSARFAGAGATREERDHLNNALLLQRLEDVSDEDRTARFVCAMCLATPDGAVLAETRGTFEGVITRAPRGTNGFGYDPLLELPELGRTSAELPPEEKNARSHRSQAARRMAACLKDLVRISPE